MFTKLLAMALATVAACVLGSMRGTRLLARLPSVSLRTVHKNLPEIWPLLASCLIFTGAAIFVFTHYSVLWLVPAALDPWSLPFLFACSFGPFAYLTAVAVRVAYHVGGNEPHKLVFAGVVLLLALSPVYVLYTLPIYHDLSDARTPDGVILQTSAFTCVPASAANALTVLGISASEREMARLAGTTVLGTSPGEVIGCLRKEGVSARKALLSVDDLRHLGSPAILLVDYPGLGPLSHAIMFDHFEGDIAHVIDPLTGRAKLTIPSLEEQWRGHAIRLSLAP